MHNTGEGSRFMHHHAHGHATIIMAIITMAEKEIEKG